MGWASRSYYADLLAAGVKIYEYKGGLLHTNSLTVDGEADPDRLGQHGPAQPGAELTRTTSWSMTFDLTEAMRLRQREYIERSRGGDARGQVARWSMPRQADRNNTVANYLGPLFACGELFDAQPVADAAHRLQPDRIGRIALDLAAQPVDLDVDRAFADLGFCRRPVRGGGWSRRRAPAKIARIFLLAVGQLERLAAASSVRARRSGRCRGRTPVARPSA